jgi:hypothetical protein
MPEVIGWRLTILTVTRIERAGGDTPYALLAHESQSATLAPAISS